MKALAIKQFNNNPKLLGQMLEQHEFLLKTQKEQPLGMVIPFSSHYLPPDVRDS